MLFYFIKQTLFLSVLPIHCPMGNVSKSKTVLDCGFQALDSGFQLLDSSFCQWNLNSRFQSLVGFQIP